MVNDRIVVRHNGKKQVTVIDGTYESGTVGLRVVDSHIVFTDLIVNTP